MSSETCFLCEEVGLGENRSAPLEVYGRCTILLEPLTRRSVIDEGSTVVIDLPDTLRDAVEQLLHQVPASALSRATERLSARYRTSTEKGRPVARSHEDILAYLAYRLPATFAAATAAFDAVRALREEWCPRTMLDLGAGPGAGLWAAATVWPTIQRMTAIEAEDEMIRSGRELARSASHEALRSASWVRADLAGAWTCDRHNLVLISYVLAELQPTAIDDFVRRAWEVTNDTLVVVEPGTPEGYARVLRARDRLIAVGGYPIAPCPHDPPCTMGEGDWCHFAVRLPRSRIQRIAKGGALGYEDEKFSYLAVSRTPVVSGGFRVLRHPQVRGGHIYLQLCTPEGLKTVIVSKRDRELFRRARKVAWGDLIDLPDQVYEKSASPNR